jgi:DNA polymerase I
MTSSAVPAANPEPTPKQLILVDGHSLAFRAYYAFAKGREGGLRTSTGMPTSVCFGFLKALLEVMELERPTAMAIAFDLRSPTFRHEADQTYKAGRVETPEDFIPDLENLKGLLTALSLTLLTVPGFEADDIIGTLARRASQAGYQVKILSGDQDLFQLITVDQGITVLHLGHNFMPKIAAGETHHRQFGPQEVKAKLGVWPEQVVDYKALCGDSSDNIPGVRGIGPKTAVQLLEEFGSLENIYQSLPKIKGAIKQKLEIGADSARHSQYLAQIALNVPLEIDLADLDLRGFDPNAFVPWLEKLQFQSFLTRLAKLQSQFGGKAVVGGASIALAQPSDATESREDDTWFFSAEDTADAQAAQVPLIAPHIIDTPEKLTALVAHLQTCTDPDAPVAWDTETTSLSPRDAALVGLGCCWGPESDHMAYLPIGHHHGNNLPLGLVLESLRPILGGDNYPKAFQNTKFDRLVLFFQGIQVQGVVFDTLLASYVLDPEGSHNLTDLSRRYLSVVAKTYSELVPKGQTIADLEISAVALYCGLDVYTTWQLVPKLKAELSANPQLLELLLRVEQPLEPVLAAMEIRGIRIDQDYLQQLSQQLEIELKSLEQQAYAVAGETFNLASPKQLSQLLFNKLNLDVKKSRKTQQGYSTDAATLEKMQGDHPLIDLMLEHRTLAKLKSTYVDALPTLVHPDTGRVHTDFNQAVTATGRLSSSNPNLQNIPIRTEFSRKIRAAFIPEPGWLLVTADYSQIELRILAHLSQEPRLISAYQENQDVHRLTAQLLLDKTDISSAERRLAKIINFGVIYGMGSQRFAREAGVSLSEAKGFIERFYDRYPGVFTYLKRMEQQAIAQGYVETILGRRRYFKFESRSLQQYRGATDPALLEGLDTKKLKLSQYDRGQLRAAANAPIQGSSADLIKLAMIKLDQSLQPYQSRLLLQVHDELVLEVPPQEWNQLRPLIETAMTSALSLSIPLAVELHSGPNWMVAK